MAHFRPLAAAVSFGGFACLLASNMAGILAVVGGADGGLGVGVWDDSNDALGSPVSEGAEYGK